MMKKTGSFSAWARRGALVVVVLGVGLAPTPARATVPVVDAVNNALLSKMLGVDTTEWLKSLGKMGEIVTDIGGIYSAADSGYSKIFDFTQLSTALQTYAFYNYVKARQDTMKAHMDSQQEDANTRQIALTRAENPSPTNQVLCKKLLLHQNATTAREFARRVASWAASITMTEGRGAGEDGDGPSYGAKDYAYRCKYKFASPLDYPDSCVDSSIKGSDGRKLEDADLSMCTITGGQILEVPEVETQTVNGVNVDVPVPKNAEQLFWLAGLNFCLHLGGPTPAPPYGKALESGRGVAAKAQWDTCKAKQNAIIRPCFELLAYYSRPNQSATKLLANERQACKAARGLGVELPKGMKDCDADKDNVGISLYQSELLDHASCKSNQYYISQKQGGARDKVLLTRDTLDCARGWVIWKDSIAQRHFNVVKTAVGMLELRGCWASVNRILGH